MASTSIGIIGGNGKFGALIRTILKKNSVYPLISDLETELSNTELVQKVNIVIIAAPIDKTIGIIQEISPYLKNHHVVIDITSIKSPIIRELQNTEADIVSVHPMFGPSIDDLKNQTVILIPVRDRNNWQRDICKFCEREGVKIKISTPEKHDKMMSLIQVLIHYNTISIGITMSKLGFDIKETLEYTSPIYRMELAMIGRIFAQDPKLYGNIPMYNENTPEVLMEHKMTLEQMSKIIITKNIEDFITLFRKASTFFDGFKEQAMRESNHLIRKLGSIMGIQD